MHLHHQRKVPEPQLLRVRCPPGTEPSDALSLRVEQPRRRPLERLVPLLLASGSLPNTSPCTAQVAHRQQQVRLLEMGQKRSSERAPIGLGPKIELRKRNELRTAIRCPWLKAFIDGVRLLYKPQKSFPKQVSEMVNEK